MAMDTKSAVRLDTKGAVKINHHVPNVHNTVRFIFVLKLVAFKTSRLKIPVFKTSGCI